MITCGHWCTTSSRQAQIILSKFCFQVLNSFLDILIRRESPIGTIDGVRKSPFNYFSAKITLWLLSSFLETIEIFEAFDDECRLMGKN
jgi:hypothetical protein